MKPLLAAILMITLAFGQAANPGGSAPPAQSVPVDQQNAQKAKVLLDQAIQALGGQAYLHIQDISQQGRTFGFHMGESEGVGVQFWRFSKYPDKDRIELTKKRDWWFVYSGNQGYETTYKGTSAVDPKDLVDYLRRRDFSLDHVLREWLNQPGIALFYEGSTVAAQKDTQRVTIMTAQNQAVTLYIDSKTFLPVKKSFSWRDPTDQQRNTEDEVYDNYRPVQGIMTPFDVTRFYNGDMSNQRFMTSVEYNKGLSDPLFTAAVSYDPNHPPVARKK
jgi:hypothetical protein